MGIVQQLDQWSQAHQPKWLVVLRVALGILLLFKGISFISHADELEAMITNSRFRSGTAFLTSYITFAHLLGGVLIIIGLLTRLAVLAQIPILIGAVFFINARNGVFSLPSEFALSLLVLFMLIFFLIEGGGPFSVDKFIKTHLL
jgi:putative oxidoreductase